MFIHLGVDTVVSLKEVIVILNFDLEDDSALTKEFLRSCQQKRQVIYISDEVPKTVVVTKEKVYYSPISSTTLKRRAMLSPVLDNSLEVELNVD